jgi:hypothetical protein
MNGIFEAVVSLVRHEHLGLRSVLVADPTKGTIPNNVANPRHGIEAPIAPWCG